jgi:hypothetical protein
LIWDFLKQDLTNMPRTSIQLLLAEADAEIPDNAAQFVTPAKVRNLIKNFLDTLAPAYGAIQKPAAAVFALTAVAQVLNNWTAAIKVTAPEWVANLVAGTCQRVLNGVPGTVTRVTANGSVEGANGANVTAQIFKNGAFTGFAITVNCTGVGDPVAFNVVGITSELADATFELRALTNNPGNYTFTNLILACENIPPNAF